LKKKFGKTNTNTYDFRMHWISVYLIYGNINYSVSEMLSIKPSRQLKVSFFNVSVI